jgi:hypothetical protein
MIPMMFVIALTLEPFEPITADPWDYLTPLEVIEEPSEDDVDHQWTEEHPK